MLPQVACTVSPSSPAAQMLHQGALYFTRLCFRPFSQEQKGDTGGGEREEVKMKQEADERRDDHKLDHKLIISVSLLPWHDREGVGPFSHMY